MPRTLIQSLIPAAIAIAAIVVLLAVLRPQVRGDDLMDKVAALEKKNAARVDPFVKDNATKTDTPWRVYYAYGAGDYWFVSNNKPPKDMYGPHFTNEDEAQVYADKLNGNAARVDHFAAKKTCNCSGVIDCTCPPGGNCGCAACTRTGTVASDQPGNPWVWENGPSGWGYYRYAAGTCQGGACAAISLQGGSCASGACGAAVSDPGASGGCSNGSCAAPARRGIFGRRR